MEPRMLIRLLALIFFLQLDALAAAPKIDARAKELIQKLTAPFQSSKSAETEFTISLHRTNAAQQDAPNRYALAIARPNKVALTLKEGEVGASIFSNGTNVTAFIPILNRYTIQPAPRDIALLVMQSAPALGDASGSMAFIAALFSPDPAQGLLSGVLEATSPGPETTSTQACERLNFSQDELTWSLWTTTNTNPQLRRIEVDISGLGVEATRMTIDFTDWKFNADLAVSRFEFTPPRDARKVDTFEVETDSDLVGEKIPEFKIKSTEGETWEPTKWKDQSVVLVFWAGVEDHTIKALTDLNDLAASHKSTKFRAINLDEKPDKTAIQKFLAKHKINLPNAIDPANAVAEAFEVDGVPMTFIIDKSGVIREAFLGHHADFKKLVARELAR